MRRSKAEITAMAILDPHHFIAISRPTAALLPKFRGLQNRHADLLSAGSVHFFADDLLDLANHPPAKRQKGIHAAGYLADHSGAIHELMADNLGLSRRIPKCWCI